MGKVKRTLKKFLIYLGAFIAVLTLTAGFKVGVFFITRSPSGGNNNNNSGGQEEVDTSGLESVLNNVLGTQNSTFALNLKVKPEGQDNEILVNTNIYLDLSGDGLDAGASIAEKLRLKVEGNVNALNQTVNFEINYLHGQIYAKVGDTNFKIETSNIKQDITKVLELATLKKLGVKITLPNLDEIKLDPSMLAMIASGLVETEVEGGKELKFNLLGFGDVVLITDEEYFLEKVEIEKLEIEGNTISADVKSNLKAEKTEIKEPENKDEFTDFSGLVTLLDKFDKFISNGLASGKINVKALENNFTVNYIVDFNDFNNVSAYFNAEIKNKPLNVYYQNNKVYASYGEYKYYIDNPLELKDLAGALKFYAKKFGIDLDSKKINEFVEKLNLTDINQLLSYFSNLKITENGINLTQRDFSVVLNAGIDSLDSIFASYKDKLTLNVTLNEKIEKIELVESEYKNILDVSLINILKSQLITDKNLALNFDANVLNTEINAKLYVDLENEFKLKLKATAFDYDLDLVVVNDIVYVNIANIFKAKGNVNELYDILKSKIDISNKDVDLDALKALAYKVVTDYGINFGLIKENDDILGVEITGDKFSAKITPTDFEEIDVIESEEYQSLLDCVKFGEKLYNLIKNNELAFNIKMSAYGYDIEGKVQYENNDINLILQTKVLEKDLTLELINKTIYINFDGLKLSLKLENAQELVDEITKLFEKEEVKDLDLNISQEEIKEIVNAISILINENNLTIIYDALNLKIDVQNEKVEFNYNDITGKITFGEKFEISEKENYFDIYRLKGFIKSAINTIKNRNLSGKVEVKVTVSEEIYSLNVEYSADLSDLDNVKVYAKTDLKNKPLTINYQNDKLFVAYNGYKYFIDKPFEQKDLVDAFKFYSSKFGLELKHVDLNKNVQNIKSYIVNKLLSNLSNLLISDSKIGLTDEEISFIINSGNEYLESVSLKYKDIVSLNITLNENIDKIELVESEYKNILDVSLINILKSQLITDKNLALNFDANVLNTEINAKLYVDLENEFKLKLKATAFDYDLDLVVVNDIVYVNIANIFKAKGNVNELYDILKSKIDISNKDVDLDALKALAYKVVTDYGINFGLIKENDDILGVEITGDKFSAKITPTDFEEIDVIESEEYQSLLDCVKFGEKLYNLIKNNELAFNIKMSAYGYDIEGKVQYENNDINLILQTKVLEKDLTLELINKTIYINFDGLKLSLKLENVQELTKEVCEILNKNISLGLSQEEIKNILDAISILINENDLTVIYDALNVKIDCEKAKIEFNYNEISGDITFGEKFEISEKEGFIDIYQLKDILKAAYNTLKTKSISGSVDVVLNLFGEDNHFDIDYKVNFKDNKLKGRIVTTFKGLEIKAYIDNKDIYLDIASLKVHINIDEIPEMINWVNNIFETNYTFDLNKLTDKDEIIKKLKEFDFDILEEVNNSENLFNVKFKNGFEIDLEFDEVISKVNFKQGGRSAILYCSSFEDVELDLNKDEFKDYTIFTKVFESTYNLIKTKQFNVNANVKKYSNNAVSQNISLEASVDATSALNAYVNVLGLNKQITVLYENKTLYFCYGGDKGLKLAIQEHALQEILGIICSALNIDTKSIPVLDDFIKKENIDSSNLSTILPKFEMKNPLQYVEYLQKFSVTDNCFAITLRAEKLGDYAGGKDVTIKIYYENGKIYNIEVNNLYLNSNLDEYINVSLNLSDFNGVKTISDKQKYIDISDSKDLIRAFINTTNLNDYHIKGKIKLNINIGIDFDAASIGVDARVKKLTTKYTEYDEELGTFVEKEKTELSGMIELSNYPLIAGVNNKNSNGGIKRVRTITIYFKDGNIYLSTIDAKKSFYDRLERTTKVSSKYLFDNLKYYMQYLLGFTDTIQNKINDAIDASNSYQGETDLSNIIEEYSKNGTKHTFKINLAEIVHSKDIGTLTASITTKNDETTLNKDYVYRLDVDLKFLDNMITLKTDDSSSDEALYLIDIGNSVDMSSADSFFAFYDDVNKFGQDGEYEKEGNSSWKQANTGTSEIRFVSKGETVQVLSGNIASKVNLPVLDNYIVDDDVVLREFKFDGWYYDETFNQEFVSGVYPRYNTTLFAKWTELDPKYHAEITFDCGVDGITLNPIKGFVGEKLTLPVLQNIETQIDENTSILKKFLGWYTRSGEKFTDTTINSNHITLFAKWSEKVTKTYSLKIYSAGNIVYEGKVEADKEFIFPNLPCFTDTTKYYTSENFNSSNLVENFVITENTIWYARNKFTVIVASNYTTSTGGTVFETFMAYEGETINLKDYSLYEVDKGSYSIEYKYLGYNLNNGETLITTSYVMPAEDASFVASWTVTEYCVVTFDTSAWSDPAWWTISSWIAYVEGSRTITTNTSNNKIKVVRNTSINTSNYVAECKYAYNRKHTKIYDFVTAAWTEGSAQNLYKTALDSQNYTGDVNVMISKNITLKPVWKHN